MEGGKAPTSLTTFSGEFVYWLSGSKCPPPPRPTSKETGVLISHPSIKGDIAHVKLTTIWARGATVKWGHQKQKPPKEEAKACH